jgi:acetyl esterase/lipase
MPLDPQAKTVLEQLNAAGVDFAQLDPPTARTLMEAMRPAGPVPELARVEDLRAPGPGGEIPVRLYAPRSSEPLPALVFFHGGGFVIGSLESHDGTCRSLADEAGCAVVSIDYRLAPEHPFPAAPEDCLAATRWVGAQAHTLGLDASRLAVGGDSAGGCLAAVVAQQCRERGGPRLAFQLLIYPVTDHGFDTPSYDANASGYLLTRDMMKWFWGHYLADPADGASPLASPLRAEKLAGLPPALVQTAELDPLRDEGEAYARRLAEAGVPTTLTRYDGLFHGFFGMGAAIERARDAVAEAARHLRGAFGR